MLHHEFQTPRNRCKHEVVRRALASVSTCLELALMKREARGFDMSSQITRNNVMTCFLWYYIGGVLSGVRYISRFIHLTQMVVIYRLLTALIINEFENII